jgi:ketosteroid isomerase-like protein
MQDAVLAYMQTELIKKIYDAYLRGDRSQLEALLAPDFHFSSPFDDRIDRASYFERCWPGHAMQQAFEIERIIPDGDTAIVTYLLVTKAGRRIHNTELVRISGGKVVEVEVFFGPTRDAQGRFVPMPAY